MVLDCLTFDKVDFLLHCGKWLIQFPVYFISFLIVYFILKYKVTDHNFLVQLMSYVCFLGFRLFATVLVL